MDEHLKPPDTPKGSTIPADPSGFKHVDQWVAPWIKKHAQLEKGLWLNNCWRGLHGPIEVLSRQAMQIYNNDWLKCEVVAQQKPQEDVYLQECMQTLGIWKSDLKFLLAEDHCDNPDFYKCDDSQFVAFHPFKVRRRREERVVLGPGGNWRFWG
eukprot:Skav224525  [mRNA]  locus=scaffold388:413815:419826:+ [translate_table: standard]